MLVLFVKQMRRAQLLLPSTSKVCHPATLRASLPASKSNSPPSYLVDRRCNLKTAMIGDLEYVNSES